MAFFDNGGAGCPRQRHRGVVDVVEPVAVAKRVLSQNHMLPPLTQHADEHAPALDGHVDAAYAVAEALADAGVTPFDADEVACN